MYSAFKSFLNKFWQLFTKIAILNNDNGVVLDLPLYSNTEQQQASSAQQQRAPSAAVIVATDAAAAGAVDEEQNVEITQPLRRVVARSSVPTRIIPSNGGCCAHSATSARYSSTAHGDVSYAATVVDTVAPNWQEKASTVLERNAAMFNNELMCDVKFIVGGDFGATQTIPAHKYILATGSSIFYAMFYGGLAECNQHEIVMPDVEPLGFLTLLRYLYCDEIRLEPDNILATFYASKKYIVPHLAHACVSYLEARLTAKNACLLVSLSQLFDEPALMQRCWDVIDAQTELVIKSEYFLDLDVGTFATILARETLNCEELQLYEAALNWAAIGCIRKGLEPTPLNERALLGQTLKLIRFPTMSLAEFADNVASTTGVLTPQETIDLFLYFTSTAKNKPCPAFPTHPRIGLKAQLCQRFQSGGVRRSNQWRYRGACDSIQFSVDRSILLAGFGLYGSSNGAANYNVKIVLKAHGQTLAESDTKFASDGSSNTFHVFFEDLLQIVPECDYAAAVIIAGSEVSFYGQDGMSEVTSGNVTFQFQCALESTNGTCVQMGQIPELIFYGPRSIMAELDSTTHVTADGQCSQ